MPETWWLICRTASPLIDAVVIMAILFAATPGQRGSRRRRVTWRRWLLALAVAATLFIARLPIFVAMGLDLFGVIHLVYLSLTIAIPFTGVVVLVQAAFEGRRGRRGADKASLAFASLTLLSPIVGFYASFVEPYRLVIEQHAVPIDPSRDGTAPVRVGVLSDIQTTRITDFERGAADELMARKPDIILLPGDLFQGSEDAIKEQIPAFHELFGKLDAPGGVYAVTGNVDASNELLEMMAGTRVRLLIDEVVHTQVHDRPVTIGGIQFDYHDPESRRVIDTLNSEPGDDLRILLAHHPNAVRLTRPRVDLVVSGHTHGGQVVLPGYGPLMNVSNLPRQVAAGGLHTIPGSARIYVSRGLGVESGQAPRLRFFCPPEIAVLTLRDGSRDQ